jgi:outer membrane protein
MKKLIVASVMALGFFTASAQTKVGHINTEELISVMPEAEVADKELKEYQGSLAAQGQDMAKEADEKAEQFVKDSAKLSASMKEIKRNEIVEMYQKVQNWNQIAQEKYNQKAQEKIAPIRMKAMDAIKAVAKENGYGYVLDASTNVLLVSPVGDDLLALVKKKLGIKEVVKPSATAPKTAAPTKN